MVLKELRLVNFRSWRRLSLKLWPGHNLFLGPNASGKTNLLEAIWFLAQGQSFRARRGAQVISWGEKQAQISALWQRAEKQLSLGVTLLQEGDGPLKKVFLVNHRRQPWATFRRYLAAVLFRPEDIRLVLGSPQRRRDYLNQILIADSLLYQQTWRRYQRARRQRNRLLEKIAQHQAKVEELNYWDDILVQSGRWLQQQRRHWLDFVNHYWATSPYSWLRPLRLDYRPRQLSLLALRRRRNEDIRRGHTSLGPQQDDFRFQWQAFAAAGGDLAFWGSRGQQRLAVLALQLAAAAYWQQQRQQVPIILLDDIFSELDQVNSRRLLDYPWPGQTIWTASQPPLLGKKDFWSGRFQIKQRAILELK